MTDNETSIDLSVIVPVYNEEQFVGACLDSILAQEGVRIELICVDDGCIDRSAEIAMSYAEADDRVRVLRQENQGLSAARNNGLKLARGSYVYFMDSDDLLAEGSLARAFELCKTNDLDLLCFSFMNFFEDEEVAQKHPETKTGVSMRKATYDPVVVSGPELAASFSQNGDYRVAAWSYVLKKSFLDEFGIEFPQGILYEDGPYATEVYLRARRAMCVNDIWLHRRVRSGSIEHSNITIRHLYGLFKGALIIQDLLNEIEGVSDEGLLGANVYLRSRIKYFYSFYITTPLSMREELRASLPLRERMAFDSWFLSHLQIDSDRRKVIRELEAELKSVRKEKSSLEEDLASVNQQLTDANKRSAARKASLEKARAEVSNQKQLLKTSRAKEKKTAATLKKVRESSSYRMGRILTAPWRKLRRLFKG